MNKDIAAAIPLFTQTYSNAVSHFFNEGHTQQLILMGQTVLQNVLSASEINDLKMDYDEQYLIPNINKAIINWGDNDFGEGLHLKQSEWNDEEIKHIMKGRGSQIACEYLSPIGQELRNVFVDGIMYQLIKEKLYANASHFRMHKYVMLRGTTEIILEEHGVDLRTYSSHIDQEMNELKEEIKAGLTQFIGALQLSVNDFVHPDI